MMVGEVTTQPDWEKFWQGTSASYQSSKMKKARSFLMAKLGARECFQLLKSQDKIENLLELGGGGGFLSSVLAQKLGLKGKDLVLIDKSLESQKVWEQFSGFGRFLLADLFKYDFGQQKFDLVLSLGLIEHWAKESDRLKLVKKHAELSRKYVLIQVPKKGWFMNFFRYHPLTVRLLRMMAKIDGYEKLYTPWELKKEISQAGLKIISFKEGLANLIILASVK